MTAGGSCKSWLFLLTPPGPLAQRGLFTGDYFHNGLIVWDHLSFSILGCFGGFNSICSIKTHRTCVFLKESLKWEWQLDLLSSACTLTGAKLSRYVSNKTEAFCSIHNTKRHSLKMNSSYPLSFSICIWRFSLLCFYPAREEFSEPEMKKQPLRGL